ncbi:MAG: hypothetical protein HY906_13140 [Deltaproteobacteria bacterium]|nr:hypothetical protein [Deltaproteobacteria bacterium]
MARKKLGEILIQAGVIDEAKLRSALAEQARWGGPLGRILVDMRIITEEALVQALSHQLNFPAVKIDEKKIPPQALELVPVELCEQHGMIPFSLSGKFLDVAMADPTNLGIIDELRIRTRLNVRAYLAGPKSIERAIAMNYRGQAMPSREAEAHIEGLQMLDLEVGTGPVRTGPRRDPFGLSLGSLADTIHGSSGGGSSVPSVTPPPSQAGPPAFTPSPPGLAPIAPPSAPPPVPGAVAGQHAMRQRAAAGPPPATMPPGVFDIPATPPAASHAGHAASPPAMPAAAVPRLAPLVPEGQQSEEQHREIVALQQRVQQLEALVARDEDVIRKLMVLLIQKGLCTRDEILERIK